MRQAFNALHFIQRRLQFLPPARRLELFPPFWLMGVKVLELDPGFRHARLHLPLTWRSRNMGNAMFGGNQASLADPIAALACARIFSAYDVWTRKLTLDFVSPGNTDLELRFAFPAATETRIRDELQTSQRSNPTFEYRFHTRDGKVCTRVHCVVAIRPKNYLQHRDSGPAIG